MKLIICFGTERTGSSLIMDLMKKNSNTIFQNSINIYYQNCELFSECEDFNKSFKTDLVISRSIFLPRIFENAKTLFKAPSNSRMFAVIVFAKNSRILFSSPKLLGFLIFNLILNIKSLNSLS